MLLDKYSRLIWDFDGVLLNSATVRDDGFEYAAKKSGFDSNEISELLRYHRANGGLSRYVKFEYLLENIANGPNDKERSIETLLMDYSQYMKKELFNSDLLIKESTQYIKEANNKLHYVASGSDQVELRSLCQYLGINEFFVEIFGSPIHKNQLVKNIIGENDLKEFALIGDSINDYEAAQANGIDFYGYGSERLVNLGNGYITHF